MEKAKVYFTKELTPEAMERMYRVLGSGLSGETAVKVHSGEMGNQNFIRPDFMKKVIEAVNGTVVECNTCLLYTSDPFPAPCSRRVPAPPGRPCVS